MESRHACIFLGSFPQFTPRHYNALAEKFGTSAGIIKNFDTPFVKKTLGEALFAQMLEKLNGEYINSLAARLEEKGAGVITCEDKIYPKGLMQFDERPFLLYTLGDISLLDTTIICVVGSRKCSFYGREQTEKITKGLCGHGITVVSGLAEGIDAVANHTALKYGKTIAVTAGGFDHIYPACNARLFKQIARDGLILSQRPPEIQAKPYMFPLRNKIMAAISRGVAVTEAGKKSGALITAANALELGRDVYVLPCNVDSHCGQGNNILLKLMQGALILGYEDILSNMGIPVESEKPKAEAAPADSEEAKMLGALERDSLSIDEISGQTGIAVNRVGAHLTIMEIKGLVKKLPGSRYKS